MPTLYGTMNKMQLWLRDYERLRLNPDAPNESWTSSKYDIECMHWTELQQIFLPALEMCWGPACVPHYARAGMHTRDLDRKGVTVVT
jgi:hypothetical protein